MAIPHLHGDIVRRTSTNSAVRSAAYQSAKNLTSFQKELGQQTSFDTALAAAAYQSGSKFETPAKDADYSRKRGVVLDDIIAPENAPAWVYERELLWRAVDKIEKHPRAQLARLFIIALPHELTDEQRNELLRGFVIEQFVNKGMIADIAIHRGNHDIRNDHGHVMLTMRHITPNGFAKTKAREWNPPFARGRGRGGKLLSGFVTDTNSIEHLRAEWEKSANAALQAAGHEARIDMRSLDVQQEEALARGDVKSAQILERLPQRHIGKSLYMNGIRLHEHVELMANNARIADIQQETEILARENVRLGLAGPSAGEEGKQRGRVTVDGFSALEWSNQRMAAQNDAALNMFDRNTKAKARARKPRER